MSVDRSVRMPAARVAAMMGWLLAGCFPLTPASNTRGGFAPQFASVPPPSPSTAPADVAEALAAMHVQIDGIGVLLASGVEGDAVTSQIHALAQQIQPVLDEDMPLTTVEGHVREAVETASRTPSARQAGVQHAQAKATQAQLAPLNKTLFGPHPEIASELEKERADIERAAQLARQKQDGAADAIARQVASRVRSRIANPPDEQIVLLQVRMAISRAEMQAVVGGGGTLWQSLAANAAPQYKAILSDVGKSDQLFAALPEAMRRASAGTPQEARTLLRQYYDRTQRLFLLSPWKRYERSRETRGMYAAAQATANLVLTLVEVDGAWPETVELGYRAMLAHRARNPEVERRISAALEERKDETTSSARKVQRKLREVIAALEVQRAAGRPLAEGDLRVLEQSKREEREVAGRLDDLAEVGRYGDAPFDASEGVARLRDALAGDDAVVSFVEYRRVDGSDDWVTAPRRIGAFVLRKSQLFWAPLGDAAALERAVYGYLAVVSDPTRPVEAKRELATGLYRTVFGPLAKAFDGVRRVRVVADGALQLLPLEALHDGSRWLADRYLFSYAISERALLPEYRPSASPARARAIVVAGGPYAAEPKPLTSGEPLTVQNFPRIAGVDTEVEKVRALLPAAEVLRGANATDAAFDDGNVAAIVHVAAHGVVLPPIATQGSDERGLIRVTTPKAPASETDVTLRLPDSLEMSRAAIVLNPSSSLHTDGFLTAYEVAAKSFWSTDLVVLSACETGRGRPDRARGVQGLRRAFFAAGASSLVTSLWSVDDAATVELMGNFYGKLLRGVPRERALSEASHDLRVRRPDPLVWAPFILIGDSGPLTAFGSKASTPADEDEGSRLRRRLAQKRAHRTLTAMGTASFRLGAARTDALDAHVVDSFAGAGKPPAALGITLLGKGAAVSISVPAYAGPGRYAVPASNARFGDVADVLAADITRLGETLPQGKVASGALTVDGDSPESGISGRFTFKLDDGRELGGEFKLSSPNLALPKWMSP